MIMGKYINRMELSIELSIDNKQRNISREEKGKIYHDNGEIY